MPCEACGYDLCLAQIWMISAVCRRLVVPRVVLWAAMCMSRASGLGVLPAGEGRNPVPDRWQALGFEVSLYRIPGPEPDGSASTQAA